MSPPTSAPPADDASRTYERAIALFQTLTSATPDQRARLLEAETPATAQLVRAMLASTEAPTSDALDQVRSDALALASSLLAQPAPPGSPAGAAVLPDTIGPYRIIRVLGQGGMGVVYEGLQQHPNRRVALKMLRHAAPWVWTTPSPSAATNAMARFQREIEAVGRLHHHGIAQIYDAGFHAQTPYFAMEFVDGLPLDAHAQRYELTIPQRVELLARVCDAVAYANAQGVIHRDLKPGNILVVPSTDAASTRAVHEQAKSASSRRSPSAASASMTTGAPAPRTAGPDPGMPKILDFGVARFVDADPGATLATTAGQVVGTLTYMSPEQLAPEFGTVDQRADVYALGIILCELLTGKLPYAHPPTSILDASQVILRDPPRPLRTLRSYAWGDLQTIVSKALAKHPGDRYASADDLAADLRRALRNEPILAQPPSTIYVLRKFAARNKPLVGAIGAAVIALCAGTGIATWQAIVASRERDTANAITSFLRDDVFGAARMAAMGPQTPVVDVLASSEPALMQRFSDRPKLRAELMSLMAVLLSNAARPDMAVEITRKAHAEAVEAFGPRSKEAAVTAVQLYSSMVEAGDPDEVLAQTPGLIERCTALFGEASTYAQLARVVRAAALLQRNKLDDANSLLDTVLALKPRGEDTHIYYGQALNLKTALLAGTDRLEGALPYAQRCVAFNTVPHRVGGPEWIASRSQLTMILWAMGQHDQALKENSATLEVGKRSLAPADPYLAELWSNQGQMLASRDQFADAETAYRNADRVYALMNDPTHWSACRIRLRLRALLHRLGDQTKLEQWHIDEIAIWKKVKPADDPGLVEAQRGYAEFLLLAQRTDEAQQVIGPLLDVTNRWLPARSTHGKAALDITLGMLRARQGSIKEARRLLEAGLAIHRDDPSPAFPDVAALAQRELDALTSEPAQPSSAPAQ